mgnify:FL=1
MKNKKMIILCLIVFVFGVSVAYAAEIILSKEIFFDNGNTNLKATNVQDALEELYSKAKSEKSCSANVAEPVLKDGLIPVKIADDGTVTYADTNKSWYDYCEKVWANAVILNDGVSYNIGDTIKENDIQSYFVWIPKYKYKLWNVDTPVENIHEIEIIFDTKDTTDISGVSCKTPMTSGSSGNCKNGEYMTHPAFISMGVNGFWVGKFETGYKGATSTTTAQVNSNDASKVIIKPNVYSWRNMTIKNAFEASYNYQRKTNSHMMKNTEWGAVAYLSHSKYGIGYEININNNSSFKTGYSSLPSTNQQTFPGTSGDGSNYNDKYNTKIGFLASTTKNISGIYDMSGGTIEYMASHMNNQLGSSGFTTSTIQEYDSKYFDVYSPSSTISSYQYRILGDATGEMGPFKHYLDGDNNSRWHNNWYGDASDFIATNDPWFNRGGHYNHGSFAGQFAFDWGTGAVLGVLGFRIVLSP